jgi:uncharacterized integral membrane protein
MKQIGGFLRSAFIALVAVCATLFVVQNLAPMEINFLGWSLQAPRFVGVLISLLLGVAVGWTIGAWPRQKKHPPPPREPTVQP